MNTPRVLVGILIVLNLSSAHAADRYWTNSSALGDFTNTLIWAGGGAPGATDNANFTNAISPTVNWTSDTTSSNAYFNAPSGTVTLGIAGNTWRVLNSFVVGTNAGSTSAVTQASGTLAITNTAGNGTLLIGGPSGQGMFTLNGGSALVDRLVSTNVGSATNSMLFLNNGTLTTKSATLSLAFFQNRTWGGLGGTAGQVATWNMVAGTNLITSPGGLTMLANSAGIFNLNVSGTGTVFTNGGDLYLGNNGTGYATVSVTAGAKAYTANTRLGGANSSTNNALLVAGSNSLFNASGLLAVGGPNSGPGNFLTVSNGGVVVSATGSAGGNNNGGGNQILIADGGSTWTNTGTLLVGQNTIASGGNLLMVSNGGYLAVGAGTTVGMSATSSNNQIVVTGGGSRWFQGGALTLGNAGYGNTVWVGNSGQVTSVDVILGSLAGASNNTVTVADAGASWSGAQFTVGSSGAGNQVVVSNGARVLSTNGVTIGSLAGAFSNSVLVTGSGSVWSNTTSGVFTVGNSGSSNTLTIANGGVVVNSSGGLTLGNLVGNNSALVTDTGSVLQLAGSLTFSTRGNSLMIANGGALIGITNAIGGVSNTMVVAGPGSSYAAGAYIFVGTAATDFRNALYVTNGGRATFDRYVLYGSSNLIYLSGSGTVVSNSASNVHGIGFSPASFNNTVRILDGATNYDGGGIQPMAVGGATGTISNVLEVAGVGSAFLTPLTAIQVGVGAGSVANGLVVTNGGSVRSLGGLIGALGGASSNWAVVGGAGATWNLGGSTLTIGVAGSTGNVVTVNSGGIVTNAGTVYVGSSIGAGNQLNILGGSFSASSLLATNTANTVTFNSGTMNLGSSFFSNGVQFVVGDGLNRAVFNTLGGTHSFSNGLLIASNSWLTGSGSVIANPSVGAVFLTNGATISPGLGTNGIGAMTVNALNGMNGSVYDVQIGSLLGVAGRSWDLLNVSGAITNLTAAPNGTNFILRADSMGTTIAGYDASRNYALKILTFGTALVSNNFTYDTSALLSGSAWKFVTNGGALYLVQSGFMPVSSNVWGGTSGFWGIATQWTNSVNPPAGGGTNVVVEFAGNAAYSATNNLAGAFTNNAIILNNSSAATSILSGSNLVFAAGASGAPGIFQNGAGRFVVSNAIVLANGLLFDGAGFGDVVVATNISGSGGITVQGGAYNTVLLASNSFVGPVVLNSSGGSLVFSNQYSLGVNNNVTVSNGTLVANVSGGHKIGTSGNGGNQQFLLTGAGAVWSNTAQLFLGSTSPFNRLVVTNGALLFSAGTTSIVGDGGTGASNNLVVVSGSGSMWTNTGNLTVGSAAAGNQMLVSRGGQVVNAVGVIGSGAGSPSNTVVVAGGGIWNNTGTLTIGSSGLGNQLVITNGGWVFDSNGTIGGSSGSNAVLVSDSGSRWINSGSLSLGNATAGGNQLVVSNGGLVTVGAASTLLAGNQNSIFIAGSGSALSNTAGQVTLNTTAGGTNTLTVANGGIYYSASSFNMGVSGGGLNLLSITNGGMASVFDTTLGNAGTNSGLILVDGPGSLLTLQRNLWMGLVAGGGNQLIISGGGMASNLLSFASRIGGNNNPQTSISSSNQVTVAGTGSLWYNLSTIEVGGTGSGGNSLLITNGGRVFNTVGATIGSGFGVISNSIAVTTSNSPGPTTNTTVTVTTNLMVAPNNNWALVDGGAWTNNSTLTIGSAGVGNRLVVSNGGVVVSAGGTIGSGVYLTNNFIYQITTIATNGGAVFSTTTNSVTAYNTVTNANNYALVSGNGSLWNSAALIVGSTSPGNTLTIADGGTVISTAGTIGNSSTNNSVVVAGAGSVWTNATATSRLLIGGSFDALWVTNGGKVFFNAGSGSPSAIGQGGSNNLLVVSDPGSIYQDGNLQLALNSSGAFNQLLVSNGGKVFTVAVGAGGVGGMSNSIIVTGYGSMLSNFTASASSFSLGTGAGASYNSLMVAQSGTVAFVATATGSAAVGGSGANSNQVTVTDPGTKFVLGTGLTIGSGGVGNRMLVTNGALVLMYPTSGNGLRIGDNGTNSVVIVTDSGSMLTNGLPTYLGYSAGFNNSLQILNGGVVANTLGVIGNGAGANSNSVLVTGSGSIWLNTAALNVGGGNGGAFNLLTISNGGIVVDTVGTIGVNGSGGSNSVVVTDPGSLWRNTGILQVGDNVTGWYNSLLVSNGATVTSLGVSLVGGTASSYNKMIVTGPGSAWTNSGLIKIGNNGSGNKLTISSNGTVVSVGGTLSANAGTSVSNSVVVTDPGSMWMASTGGVGNLIVGYAGNGNSLMISNGGLVVNANGYVGAQSGTSLSNSVVVTGSGSVWSNTSALYIGANGGSTGGNTLTISSGGKVVSVTGFIGPGGLGYSADNSVLVTDSGSTWTTSTNGVGDLTLGYGARNSLVVSNGGTVVSGAGAIGSVPGSFSNSVWITGNGSSWASAGTVSAGTATSSNNSMYVNGGGLVESFSLVAGSSLGNWISNSGGIYQFTTNAPTITPNGLGRIAINNGTISFRGITNANVMGSLGSDQVGNILFAGNNTFRLNNASNWVAGSQDYTFDTGISPSNYVALEMVNGGTAWRSAWLKIGQNGTLLISNTTANLYGVVTNAGSITVANASATFWSNVVLSGGSSYVSQNSANSFSNILIALGASFVADALSPVTVSGSYQNLNSSVFSNLVTVSGSYVGNGTTNQFTGGLLVNPGGSFVLSNNTSTVGGATTNLGNMSLVNSYVTYGGPVVISGLYSSDPSTNMFTTNVIVTASGALTGSNGDLFVFQKDFQMLSTNRSQFSLWRAAVLFTNGPTHTLSISNSGALDLGHFTNFAMVSSNFSIGTLSIAPGDRVTLAGSKSGGLTNALYVGWLDIQGWSTNGATRFDEFLSASNSIASALTLTGNNLYYDYYDSRNAWLNEFVPDLGYELWGPGNGLLLPIPEPSPLLALGAGLSLLLFLRRQKAA